MIIGLAAFGNNSVGMMHWKLMRCMHKEHAHIHDGSLLHMLCSLVSFNSSPFKSMPLFVVMLTKRTHEVVETAKAARTWCRLCTVPST